jgi:hypothetical protein
MGGHVTGGIEGRMRRAALPPAGREVVAERLLPRSRDVGVADGVPRRIEERMRLPSFAPAVGHVVGHGIEPGLAHVVVTPQIPGGVEQRSR